METSGSMSKCPFSRPQGLTNFESSKEVTDILHMKSTESGVCSTTVCHGSLMNIRRMPLEVRAAPEVLTQAKELLEEYYKDIKKFESKEHMERVKEVTQSVTRTGTYDLTYDELSFGAKLGWRNAPRCIGRISWNTLHLIDGRHVKTAKEMFALMLEHLEYATNKGNIRSTITIFPQRRAGQRDFRVWNPQLICFAGYEQPDGSIIGDPAYKEFTKVCQNLGWKGKGGRFDVLPWVVNTPTGKPEFFEIPEESVLRVPLKHPEFKWFEELGLEWFAVPAVTSLMLDCGGLQFTASPFNGWYMASEIGTRDLCDERRYNLLSVFGEKMGLDTRTPSTLWKDKATLEANVAVLHSFKEMGVTLVDHHTAAETFMQFHSNEYRQRGGCPADWTWIVPPLSGSLTPVFHQEMSLYYLKPGYEYQIPGWVSFEKQNKVMSGEKKPETDRPIKKFKKAALAVSFASTLYAGAMARRVRIAIIYASETGKAQNYANTLHNILSQNFNPQVICMDDYDVKRLSSENMVVLLASTTGVGEPPKNGKEFTKNLYELRESSSVADVKEVPFWDDYNEVKVNGINNTPVTVEEEKKLLAKKNRTFFSRLIRRLVKRRKYEMDDDHPDSNALDNIYLSSNSLYKSSYSLGKSTNSLFRTLDPASDVSFSVFALGSTNYKYFCAFGKYIDNMMSTLGGDRVMNLSCGDETENQQEAFDAWTAKLLEVCCERFQVKQQMPDISAIRQITNGKQVKIVESTNEQKLSRGLSKIHGKDVVTCSVLANTTLYEDREKWYQKVVISTDKSPSLLYEPGDHVGVFPSNNAAMVQGILTRLTNVYDPDLPVQIMMRKDTAESWAQHEDLPVTSIRTLLERVLDVSATPSQSLLQLMADSASNNLDFSQLNHLAKNIEEYRNWKKWNQSTLLEVLAAFPSVKLDAGVLLCRLPLLQPRLYSISSSPAAHEGQFALTVANFSFKTQGGKGPLRKGVCTSYLKQIRKGDRIEVFHKSAPEFHLPKNNVRDSAPVLMIGAGSGVAPFRGFWQHYYHQTKNLPKGQQPELNLYYGCQTAANDLYAKEKVAMSKANVLTKAFLALSREPKLPKTYVQDLFLRNGKKVYKQMVKQGGHLYICGSEGIADGVQTALLAILQDHGKCSLEKAKAVLQQIKDEQRYHEDIFGSGSPV